MCMGVAVFLLFFNFVSKFMSRCIKKILKGYVCVCVCLHATAAMRYLTYLKSYRFPSCFFCLYNLRLLRSSCLSAIGLNICDLINQLYFIQCKFNLSYDLPSDRIKLRTLFNQRHCKTFDSCQCQLPKPLTLHLSKKSQCQHGLSRVHT